MKRIIFSATAILITLQSFALSLIDTGKPAKLVQPGLRVGFTSSNLTNNYDQAFSGLTWKNQHWGNGFLIGGVADVNVVGCFAIQPGIFFYRRANTFNYLTNNQQVLNAYEGRQYDNVMQIPILFSFRLGVAELAQVQFDLGPYMAWGYSGKVKYTEYLQSVDGVAKHSVVAPYHSDGGIARRSDFGIKTGVGILAMGHVYLGAHFSYGSKNTLQAIYGVPTEGHSKVWQFTVGYNF